MWSNNLWNNHVLLKNNFKYIKMSIILSNCEEYFTIITSLSQFIFYYAEKLNKNTF